MAQKKFLDFDGLLYFWNKVKTYVDELGNKKVDKVDGKALSTNDYTNEEKQKLAGLNNYELPKASKEILGGIKVGAGLTIDGEGNLSATGGGEADSVNWENVVGKPTKLSEFENDSKFQTDVEVSAAVSPKADKTYVDEQLATKADKSHTHVKADITDFPTNVSEFTNDSGYQTAANVEETLSGKGYLTQVPDEYITDTELSEKGYQTSSQVESAITSKGYQTSSQVSEAISSALGGITQFDFEVVEELPPSGVKGKIYLVANSGSGQNIYDEYIWIDDKFESLGKKEIDLSGYVQDKDLIAITNGEIDSVIS